MQIDCRENVGNLGYSDVKLGEEFDFATRDLGIELELSCHSDEIFLENLQRNDSCSVPPMLVHEIAGAALFGGRVVIIGVNQNVCVEKATSAHEFRLG